MNLTLYKTLNKQPALNEALAKFIIGYCLGNMSSEEFNYDMWHVGISDNGNNFPKKYYFGECSNHLEALQTKQYLVSEKKMIDDNDTINGNEIFIYVYRD